MDKDRKNEERAVRARSVHFDGQISEQHDLTKNYGTTGMKQISVIGKEVYLVHHMSTTNPEF